MPAGGCAKNTDVQTHFTPAFRFFPLLFAPLRSSSLLLNPQICARFLVQKHAPSFFIKQTTF
jgi:hypothetical protein